jgi:hypothetical protein
MYRCHFTYNGRIVAGEDLLAGSLEEAIREGKSKLAGPSDTEPTNGFEIWNGVQLLHTAVPNA